MGFFKKLFGLNDTITIKNINEKLEIGKYFYLMDYGDHYSDFLKDIDNRNKVIAELFVFRAWTTQFGFRMFSSKPEISEKIIGEVFNQGKLGMGMLKKLEQVDIENELGYEYVDLIDRKWQKYDTVFIDNKSKNNDSDPAIPTRQICGKLTENCDIHNPGKFMWICTDFINHLDEIKQEAIETGLLNNT